MGGGERKSHHKMASSLCAPLQLRRVHVRYVCAPLQLRRVHVRYVYTHSHLHTILYNHVVSTYFIQDTLQ